MLFKNYRSSLASYEYITGSRHFGDLTKLSDTRDHISKAYGEAIAPRQNPEWVLYDVWLRQDVIYAIWHGASNPFKYVLPAIACICQFLLKWWFCIFCSI